MLDDAGAERLPSDVQTTDSSDVVTLRERETARKRHDREAAEFWKGIFDSEVGRREMWAILNDAGAFNTRFACGPTGFPDANATWFHAGSQAFGQGLYQKWLARDPVAVAAMHHENDARFTEPKKKKSR